MCGIAGFIDLWDTNAVRARDDRAGILENMCEVIRYRGPDDSGSLLKDGVALGMRRLSIIDLAGGHQPMSGEDGSATIVFNGEIYNFRELQPNSKRTVTSFRRGPTLKQSFMPMNSTAQPVWTICAGCSLSRFGMTSKRSFSSRAIGPGEKPLYYTLTPTGTLVFGSELKSLLEHPGVKRETSAESLDAYFSLGYVPDPLSIFKDIKKLPPGHFLTFSNGNLLVKEYWDFTYETNGTRRREEDYLEELRELLDEAVRIRLGFRRAFGRFPFRRRRLEHGRRLDGASHDAAG